MYPAGRNSTRLRQGFFGSPVALLLGLLFLFVSQFTHSAMNVTIGEPAFMTSFQIPGPVSAEALVFATLTDFNEASLVFDPVELSLQQGTTTPLSLTIGNQGVNELANASVVLQFPDGVVPVFPDNALYTVVQQPDGTWLVSLADNLLPGTSVIVDILLEVAPGTPDAAAEITAAFSANNQLLQTALVSVVIGQPPSGLFLVHQVDRNVVEQDDVVLYTLSVSNLMAVSASQVVLNDLLPPGIRFIAGSVKVNNVAAADPLVAADGRTLTFTLGNIAAGGSIAVSFNAYVTTVAPAGELISPSQAHADNAISNAARAAIVVRKDAMNTSSHVVGRVLVDSCSIGEVEQKGHMSLRLRGQLVSDYILYTLVIESDGAPVQDYRLHLSLPEAFSYIDDSSWLDNEHWRNPVEQQGSLVYNMGDLPGEWRRQLQFKVRPASNPQGIYEIAIHANYQVNGHGGQKSSVVMNTYEQKPNGNVVIGEESTVAGGVYAENRVDNAGETKASKGLANVRLIMEDGRFVDTDEEGRYHLEGLKPGTHVIQIDPESIPEGYEAYLCESNTRFARSPTSQFVDVSEGLIWRANFHLRSVAKTTLVNTSLYMRSRLDKQQLDYVVRAEGSSVGDAETALVLGLPAGIALLPDSVRVDGKPAQARAEDGHWHIMLPAQGDAWQHDISFSGKPGAAVQGELVSKARIGVRMPEGQMQLGQEVTNILKFDMSEPDLERYNLSTHFAQDAWSLTPADTEGLDRLVSRLRGKPVIKVEITAYTDDRLLSPAIADRVKNHEQLSQLRADAYADYLARALGLDRGQIETTGLGSRNPVASNFTEEGRARNRRVDLVVHVRDTRAPLVFSQIKPESIRQEDRFVLTDKPVAKSVGATAIPVAPLPQGVLSLAEGDVLPGRSATIRVNMDSRLKQVLYIDDQPVPDSRVGFRKADPTTNKTIYTYFGVNMGEPGEHTLRLKGTDTFGNVRFDQVIRYSRSGDVSDIRFVSAEGNIADGKTPVQAQLELVDVHGKVIHASTELLIMDGELQPWVDGDVEKIPLVKDENRLVEVSAGGVVKFRPVGKPGLYRIRLQYNEVERDIKIYVKPHYRDWVLVGLADGTVGHRDLSGNMQELEAADLDEEYYEDGKLAFYAKGKVLGKYLLTVAFDSSKESQDDERLLQMIDPDEYYTLYGDKAEQQYDAQSREKLYLRLDADKFYALFGDFNTDLTVAELSRYSRSFTGAKGVYESEHLSVNAFAAQTSSMFSRDEILGDGTSGLYRLSKKNVVVNSEKVVLQVRDRFHSERIISETALSRFADYNLDYLDGTLYFKQPIPRHDSDFNPVYIVVDYEAHGSGKENMVAGGRAAVKMADDTIELGVTHIDEGSGDNEAQLSGIDARFDITDKTQLKAEYATSSKRILAQEVEADAWLAELVHRGEKIEGTAYLREEEGDFGLGHTNQSEIGRRKAGVRGEARLHEDVQWLADAGREQALDDSSQRDMLTSSVLYTPGDWEFSLGATTANDSLANGDSFRSDMLNTGIARTLLDDRMRIYTRSDWLLGSDGSGNASNLDYPERHILGTEYAITDNVDIYSEYELANSSLVDAQSTRAGVRSRPWENASMNNGLQQDTSDIQARTFAVFGLTQAVPLGENWRASFSYDQTRTMDLQVYDRVNDTLPLASGSINNIISTNGMLDEDFWATTAGLGYQSGLHLFDSRMEYRDADTQQKYGVFTGWQRNLLDGIGHALRWQGFITEDRFFGDQLDTELRYSLVVRPLGSDVFWFNRTELKHLSLDGLAATTSKTNKLVEHLAINWVPNDDWQVATHLGYKLTRTDMGADLFTTDTFLLGNETRYDLTPRWDIGAHYHIITTPDVGITQDSYGLSVGVDLAKNLWLSVGYNARGYVDDDFDANGYTAKGPFLKLRFKFDQDTFNLGED